MLCVIDQHNLCIDLRRLRIRHVTSRLFVESNLKLKVELPSKHDSPYSDRPAQAISRPNCYLKGSTSSCESREHREHREHQVHPMNIMSNHPGSVVTQPIFMTMPISLIEI